MAKQITKDALQAMAPGTPIEELEKIAAEDGYEIVGDASNPEPDPEPATAPEEAPAEEVKAEDEDAPGGEVTGVPHESNLKNALKEERDKRKVLSAKLTALEAKFKEYTPPAQTQQLPQPVPPQETPDSRIKSRLGITDDIDTLLFTDPKKHTEYVKELAKEEIRQEMRESRAESMNRELMQTFGKFQNVDASALDAYAEAALDEMSRKDARVIERSLDAIKQKNFTSQDVQTAGAWYEKCHKAFLRGSKPEPEAPPQEQSSNLTALSNMPRTSKLTGTAPQTVSDAEVSRLLDSAKTPKQWAEAKKILLAKGMLQE